MIICPERLGAQGSGGGCCGQVLLLRAHMGSIVHRSFALRRQQIGSHTWPILDRLVDLAGRVQDDLRLGHRKIICRLVEILCLLLVHLDKVLGLCHRTSGLQVEVDATCSIELLVCAIGVHGPSHLRTVLRHHACIGRLEAESIW